MTLNENIDNLTELFRKALIDANGGSTKSSYESVRNNRKLFETIEDIFNNLELDDEEKL